MEAVNDDDEAMMAMMGMKGFGSTKVLVSASLPCFALLIVIFLDRVSMSPETKTVRLM
jgi:U4/U6.U5 small nuclear ribonucleoproteins